MHYDDLLRAFRELTIQVGTLIDLLNRKGLISKEEFESTREKLQRYTDQHFGPLGGFDSEEPSDE